MQLWAHPKLVKTHSDYHKEGVDLDEMIVLDTFLGQGSNEEGVQVRTVGIVLSSRNVFKNLKTAIECKKEDNE